MFIGSRTVLGAVCTSWMSCLLRPNRIQDTRVDTNKEAEFDDLQHLRDHYGCRKSRQGLVQVRHWDFILRWGRRPLGGLSKGEMSFNLELWSVILASVWEVEHLNLSKLRERLKDRKAWRAAVLKESDTTEWFNNNRIYIANEVMVIDILFKAEWENKWIQNRTLSAMG